MKSNKKKSEDFWDSLTSRGKILTEEEAEAMEKIVEKVRKEHGFRKVLK